jgi:hypothetical protein
VGVFFKVLFVFRISVANTQLMLHCNSHASSWSLISVLGIFWVFYTTTFRIRVLLSSSDEQGRQGPQCGKPVWSSYTLSLDDPVVEMNWHKNPKTMNMTGLGTLFLGPHKIYPVCNKNNNRLEYYIAIDFGTKVERSIAWSFFVFK